jgi:hypothetical protein
VSSLPSADTLKYVWRSCSLQRVGNLNTGLLLTRVTVSLVGFAEEVGGEAGSPGGGLAVVLSASLSSIGAGATEVCWGRGTKG